MLRLFSRFARGWSGAGLLLMRFVAASALIHEAIPIFRTEPATKAAVLHVIAGAAGLLLFGRFMDTDFGAGCSAG